MFCIILHLKDVQTKKLCHCNCCNSTSCNPAFVVAINVGEICNSTTCDLSACFMFNGTRCPMIGSDGLGDPVCAHAYTIFHGLTLFPLLITFIIFAKFYRD
ncbi:unnamed protein product [Rotaria socialis]|nr:unnamed protein product [Rotaria socialis]